MPRYTDQDIARAVTLYTGGEMPSAIADEMEVSLPTVTKWLKEEGVWEGGSAAARWGDEAVEKYLSGATYEDVAEEYGVVPSAVVRWAKSRGVQGKGGRNARTESSRREAIDLYRDGKTFSEIADKLDLKAKTVSRWVKQEGVEGEGGRHLQARRDSETSCKMYGRGFTVEEIAEHLGRATDTVSGWLKAEDIEVLSSQARRTPEEQARINDKISATRTRQEASREPLRKPCAHCGEPFDAAGCARQKFCSMACHGEARRDPDARPEVVCTTCGVTFEKWASQVNQNNYCSRRCFHSRNTNVDKVAVDGWVLDSSWEALFYGLCKMLHVPVQRVDREASLIDTSAGLYAPDFFLPTLGLHVEVKGQQTPSDSDRQQYWRQEVGPLAVLDEYDLDRLRTCDPEDFGPLLTRTARQSDRRGGHEEGNR